MKKILIVDDEKIIAAAIQRCLGRVLPVDKYAVSSLNHGVAAIQLMQEALTAQAPFDLVIMDLLMPEMNGSDVLDWIYQSSKSTKVIMMTAYGDPSTKEDLIKRGAQMVLQKPFEDIMIFPKLVVDTLA